jgi:hypothetical protein
MARRKQQRGNKTQSVDDDRVCDSETAEPGMHGAEAPAQAETLDEIAQSMGYHNADEFLISLGSAMQQFLVEARIPPDVWEVMPPLMQARIRRLQAGGPPMSQAEQKEWLRQNATAATGTH